MVKTITEIALKNQSKVLKAFTQERVSYEHFQYSTGYGYDDLSREALERIVARIFNAESALVRAQIASGTHAIACCLYGNLKSGDKLISVTGTPYDTLESVLGHATESPGSLKDMGINYTEVPLVENRHPDLKAIANSVSRNKPKMILIQRSRGYSWRPSISIDTIAEIIKIAKANHPEVICFVDNCYGEFVEELEPTEIGADIVAGSMIKNMGGGLVPTGGYIAGAQKYVMGAATRLTAPGIGSHVGATLMDPRITYQGIFMAPHTTKEALMSAVYAATVFSELGFEVSPAPKETRCDIIQAIKVNSPKNMELFCRGIQEYSPIDSHVAPIPSPMAGYESKVIMAGGTFVQGSSIELSADGPIREPYVVYLQGGLSFEHSRLAIDNAAKVLNENCIKE